MRRISPVLALTLSGLILLLGPNGDRPARSDFYVRPFTVTAYCDYGYTASGEYVHSGTIAAGYAYPFFTRLSVPGYGDGQVLDRGGAIGDENLDLWMPSCDQAIQWGRRHLFVKVYR